MNPLGLWRCVQNEVITREEAFVLAAGTADEKAFQRLVAREEGHWARRLGRNLIPFRPKGK